MPWKYRAVYVPYPKLFDSKWDDESDLYTKSDRKPGSVSYLSVLETENNFTETLTSFNWF